MAALTVISLGWGVQSFALACMSALGVLPKVDAAVHADTGHERAETYVLAAEFTPWLEARGVRVVTVRDRMAGMAIDDWGGVFLPAFTSADANNAHGMLRRQCTQRWKIAPIKRWSRDYLKDNDLPMLRNSVQQWIGITLDEITRMRASCAGYIELVYPFITYLGKAWSRVQVKQWLNDNGLPIPVKSSCVFCPYHDRATWREVRQNQTDWAHAVEVDEAIRNKRPDYLCYVCNQRKPLPDCDFSSQQDHGQLTLWEEEECSGMCFL